MKLDVNAEKLISMLNACGHSAYAVGGCVRDSIMGVSPGDFDITTSATPQEMEEIFEKNFVKYAETGIKHGTVTAILNHTPYEVTTFRIDGKYNDSRHPEDVLFVRDVKNDLARRDFTMNAIAFNKKEGYVDLFNGIEDIENKIIRCVGDPDQRFKEDALRILRALRFSAVLGFKIEEKTKQAVFRNKSLLLNIASERVFVEIKKLLLGDNVENVLSEYREVLAVVIPELVPSFDFPQHSKWHIYDVYTHIVKSVAVAPKKDYIRFALLFHDVGKPFTKTVDENGFDHFKGHPIVSREMAEKALKRFKASKDFCNKVLTLVEIHDSHIHLKHKSIKKWLRLLGEDLIYDFADVKIADMLTHNLALASGEVDMLREIRNEIGKVIASGEPYKISDLKISGRELVDIGFKGSQIADELDFLVNIVSGDPCCNTPEKLFNLALIDYKNLK